MYLMVPTTAPAPRVDEKTGATIRDGRWRLNAGSLMTLPVPGLNDDKNGAPQPVNLIVDLEGVTFARSRVPALSGHDSSQIIGYWDTPDIVRAGSFCEGIEADLHFVIPRDDHEREIFREASRLKALSEQGVPLQVSVGIEPGPDGEWEKVTDASVVVNGRTYMNDSEYPLFILRNGRVFESSMCTFGADSETGRVAASKPTPVIKEHTMSDRLKVLLSKHAEAHHGLIARCVAKDESDADIVQKIHSAELQAKDSEITKLQARLKASEDDIEAKAKAKAEDDEDEAKAKAKAKAEDEDEDEDEDCKEDKTKAKAKAGSTKAVRFGATDGAKGKPSVRLMSEALSVTASQFPDLKGVPLRRKARELFPDVADG